MTIRKESPNPRLPLRGGLHLSKTSPGRIAVFETPMPVAALRSIPHSGESNPWSTAQFVKALIPRHISLAWLPYGLKKQTIPQPSYSIVTDWQPVMIDIGALWVRLSAAGCLRSMIRAQSRRRNIRLPVSSSQERPPGPSLSPVFLLQSFRSNPSSSRCFLVVLQPPDWPGIVFFVKS